MHTRIRKARQREVYWEGCRGSKSNLAASPSKQSTQLQIRLPRRQLSPSPKTRPSSGQSKSYYLQLLGTRRNNPRVHPESRVRRFFAFLFVFFFALDLKSEIKTGIILQNVLSILLGKLVGTGSIKLVERYYRGGIRIKIKSKLIDKNFSIISTALIWDLNMRQAYV